VAGFNGVAGATALPAELAVSPGYCAIGTLAGGLMGELACGFSGGIDELAASVGGASGGSSGIAGTSGRLAAAELADALAALLAFTSPNGSVSFEELTAGGAGGVTVPLLVASATVGAHFGVISPPVVAPLPQELPDADGAAPPGVPLGSVVANGGISAGALCSASFIAGVSWAGPSLILV
jgi:hypothetical protein